MVSSFSAAIKRLPGGFFAKTPKSQAMWAVPAQTSLVNLGTYFSPWPKRRAEFIMYGIRHASSTAAPPSTQYHGKGHADSDINEALGLESLYGGAAAFAQEHLKVQAGADGEAAAKAAAAAARPLGLAGVVRRFKKGEKLSMVTAYDFPSARLARQAGLELVLVGDSLGNCRLGLPDTVGVTMEDIVRATTAVRRGVDAAAPPGTTSPKPLIIGDMPFGSYLMKEEALRNAAALRMAGAELVKLEGGRHLAPLVKALTEAGIAVMSHIGLEPQRALLQGGLRLQGTTATSAQEIVEDAKELVKAGAVALVVEMVPEEVGAAVQASVPSIPVIGIGAGGKVAGQVLVCDDMLGLHGRPPSFAKMFADVGRASAMAYANYVKEVRSGQFPGDAHTRRMKREEREKLQRLLPEVLLESPPTPPCQPCAAHGAPPAGIQVAQNHRPQGNSSGGLELLPGGRFVQRLNGGASAPRLSASARGISQAVQVASDTHKPVFRASEHRELKCFSSNAELRAWRRSLTAGHRVAFVPTMGNLHEGHLELVDEGLKQADEVLVSIFVNPSQFAAHEDLGKYPRTLEEDLQKLRARGATAVFLPQPSEMYPSGSPGSTIVVPKFVEGKSEAIDRPTHFIGVATVCLKLFNLCEPDVAIFGQKDAMQCVVISRMLEDFMLHDRISLHVMPTSREDDGLARSSRNSYLTPVMRQKAPAIYRVLCKATGAVGATPGSVRSMVQAELESEGFDVSYVSVADAREMDEKSETDDLANAVVSIACGLKENGMECRLIDNIVVPARN
eukprot:TRINITY_DN166_c0_g1_i1.p1 TRINITY_DN166_c0_g1~~TRINITY_DN166_c0_g1_i1.p1  ORF type:complete len:788 (+),score=176.46 TRINITY_DN166_c0_g1_i1:76-2439(+)